MIPGSHAALSAAPDEQDQARRLERFRAAHPGVPVLLLGACPKAWVGDQKIETGRCAACSTTWRRSSARTRIPPAREPPVTAGFDPATPNMARVYDYWLGGKDHYPADRAEAERLLGIYPPLRDLVRENRAFVTQAVSWAARQGTGQFIDLGAGLPASPAVHQAARTVLPTARVAYVDIDPVVLSHARALLATSDGVSRRGRGPARPRGRAGGPGAAGRHRPGPACVRHLRRGAALPGRRRRPGGDRGIRAADGAGQLPGHLRGPL